MRNRAVVSAAVFSFLAAAGYAAWLRFEAARCGGGGGVRVVEQFVDERLVFAGKGAAVEGAAEVPVGGVEDPHADTVSQPTDINDGAL